MNVLSLFDGMSCGQIALNRAGINYDKYYASEIDKYAITVTQANYPNTIQLGDINNWGDWDIDWSNIDLILAGSPCQGFSFAGKGLAFDDPRSALFFKFLDILNFVKSFNPHVKFLLENVKMKKEYLNVISECVGVNPVFINSALVSAQNRQRLYWCNWKVNQPVDKQISAISIIDNGFPAKTHRHHSHDKGHRTVKIVDKLPTLSARYGRGWPNCDSQPGVLADRRNNLKRTSVLTNSDFYNVTPKQAEAMQTVPDNYTNHVSNTQRYKMLGNGWTVDVIVHILKEAGV